MLNLQGFTIYIANMEISLWKARHCQRINTDHMLSLEEMIKHDFSLLEILPGYPQLIRLPLVMK